MKTFLPAIKQALCLRCSIPWQADSNKKTWDTGD